MYIYIGLSLFCLFCMVVENQLGKRINRKILTVILVLPLFVLSAFRAPSIGNDTYNYYKSFLMVSREQFFSVSQSRFEIGYIFYMRIVALFGIGYLGFQIITSAFILGSVSNFIYKYSNNIAFSFFIFITSRMYFGSMNLARQYLAMAILLFSINSIKERKLIKFLLLVLLATSMHFTAIFFLIVYPLSKFKFNNRTSLILLSIGIVSAFMFDKLIIVFINLTGRYAGYLNSVYFNFEDNISIYLILIINLLFLLIAFITRYWRYGERKNKDSDSLDIVPSNYISSEKLWYEFCILTVIFSILGLNATIISRIEMYFSIFFLAYIPSVTGHIKSKRLRAIVATGIILGLLVSFIVIMVYRPYWTSVFPYVWYWNSDLIN